MTGKLIRHVCGLLLSFVVFYPLQGLTAEPQTYSLVYLTRDGDPYYEPHKAYPGIILHARHRPVEGARLAIKENAIVGRALGFKFELIERALGEDEDSLNAVEELHNQGVDAFLLDLPLEDVRRLAAALRPEKLLLFNIRHYDDTLRGEDCSPVLFHSLPSRAMLMDALAQYLFKKNWKKVLILEGELPEDRAITDAFEASAGKFGLKISDRREFVLGNDPRKRDRNNITILTAGADYDVVFVADSFGEVGRYIPYQTQDPRPVIGTEGLISSAWHWSWERHGAPQLNQRFERAVDRLMEETDWAAWAAVKSVVEAIVRAGTTDATDLSHFLTSDAGNVDIYKGAPGTYRAWNNQLRQPILLHTHNAVVERAPIEGFLHEQNNLDTLGADERESLCHFSE